ncbi:MAG TPA: VWA domain-containing protein, partial [Cellvibrio sp.]
MNRQDINDDDLQQLLQEQPPKPDADAKARHIAAAMAAFAAQQSAEKKSTVLQGFLQRLRLTRDTNHHGTNSMNNSINSNNDKSFDNRPFWQKPALISGIAASSLAVLAGLTFMQHLMINSGEQELAARIAEQSLHESVPLNVQEPAKVIISEDKKILADLSLAEDEAPYAAMEAA